MAHIVYMSKYRFEVNVSEQAQLLTLMDNELRTSEAS